MLAACASLEASQRSKGRRWPVHGRLDANVSEVPPTEAIDRVRRVYDYVRKITAFAQWEVSMETIARPLLRVLCAFSGLMGCDDCDSIRA